MINHGPLGAEAIGEVRGPDQPQIGHKQGLKALTISARYRNGGTMNGLLAICSICREIIS